MVGEDQIAAAFSTVAEAGVAPAEKPVAEEAPQQEKDFVSNWLNKIDSAKESHKDDFEKITESILLANGIHWPGQTLKDERYIANIIGRIIQRRVNSLYAKNPTVIARRAERMEFSVWDGRMESIQQAMQMPQDPFNAQLIQDVMMGAQRRNQLNKISKTLEIVFRNQIKQQHPVFKRQMKQLIRRVESTGVGFVRLDYHRDMDVKPSDQVLINDLSGQLSSLESMLAQQEEGYEVGGADAEAEKIRIKIASLQKQEYILRREGLLFSFPRTKSMIIDPNCYQLEGFLGARWLAEEFFMDDGEVLRVSGVDIKAGGSSAKLYTQQNPTDSAGKAIAEAHVWKEGKDKTGKGYYCVYLVHDIDTCTSFMICRGHDTYLKAPEPPKLTLERFFPYYTLAFNETENPDSIYPDSTSWSLRHSQKEYNRAKEALRQHRIAMKPLYVSGTGALAPEDKVNVAEHEAHDILELQSLLENESAENKFQMVKKHPIDPNTYETQNTLKDAYLVAGSSPADVGQVSGATATETGLAADSHGGDLASNADDLDDLLNVLFKDGGTVILTEFDIETVKRIAGPGAMWPEFSRADLADDIYLEIEAGSAGRPNKAAIAAAIRSNMPFVIQMPGANPEFWLRKLTENTFDNINLEDAYLEGLPAIITMNAQAQASTGDPSTDPNAQGPQGSQTNPAGRPEPVTGLGVGGQPDAGMPGATAVGPAPERAGGLMTRIRGMLGGQA